MAARGRAARPGGRSGAGSGVHIKSISAMGTLRWHQSSPSTVSFCWFPLSPFRCAGTSAVGRPSRPLASQLPAFVDTHGPRVLASCIPRCLGTVYALSSYRLCATGGGVPVAASFREALCALLTGAWSGAGAVGWIAAERRHPVWRIRADALRGREGRCVNCGNQDRGPR